VTEDARSIEYGMQKFWIVNNMGFLFRYWSTARESLEKVMSEPEAFTEFMGDSKQETLVRGIVSDHLEHHNYSGVLLTYAILDEFMITLSKDLGRAKGAPIVPGDLRDRGIKRYKKFIHQVCGVQPDEIDIDWSFLEDLAEVRNAIIHANGNKSLLGDPKKLERVVDHHAPFLQLKHSRVKLVITDDFVKKAMSATQVAALELNEVASKARSESSAQ
jgi:hypothetical protein